MRLPCESLAYAVGFDPFGRAQREEGLGAHDVVQPFGRLERLPRQRHAAVGQGARDAILHREPANGVANGTSRSR